MVEKTILLYFNDKRRTVFKAKNSTEQIIYYLYKVNN